MFICLSVNRHASARLARNFFKNLGRRVSVPVVAVPDGHLLERCVSFAFCRVPVQAFPVVPDDLPERVAGGERHANAVIPFPARNVGVDQIVLMVEVQ